MPSGLGTWIGTIKAIVVCSPPHSTNRPVTVGDLRSFSLASFLSLSGLSVSALLSSTAYPGQAIQSTIRLKKPILRDVMEGSPMALQLFFCHHTVYSAGH